MECLRFFSLNSCFAKPITSIDGTSQAFGVWSVALGSVEGVGSGRSGWSVAWVGWVGCRLVEVREFGSVGGSVGGGCGRSGQS